MSAYWNSYNNALAAGQTSVDAFEQGQQRRLAGQAGNALAQGDYGAASGALYRGGDLTGGMAVDRMGQQRQQQTAMAQAQGMDQRREGLKQAATAIRRTPAEQRAQVYQGTIRPTLQQLGMPDDLLMQIDQSPMDDASLDAFLAALGGEQPGVKYMNTPQGVVAIRDGEMSGQLAYEAPDKAQEPEYVEGPDGIYERTPEGWKKVATFGPAPRQPQRSSGGGGMGSAPGVAPARSYGSGAEPVW